MRCLYCGCKLPKGKRKYCNDDCKREYHRHNPTRKKVFNILKNND